MNSEQIIDGVLEREGAGTPPYRAPDDAGGRTSWGISEHAHPDLWRPGPPTKEQARVRLSVVYLQPFAALDVAGTDALMAAIVDDAVMSGVDAATKRLQVVLGVALDGVIGPQTIEAFKAKAGARLLQRYVVERAVRAARLVQLRRSDATNIEGWIIRILRFLPDPAGRDM